MVVLSQVIDRLTQLGYIPNEADTSQLEFELELILDYVTNYCNFHSRTEIPEILDKRIIDRVCAEYLLKKKNSGQLEDFNYEAVIKMIKEGDTQIQYASETESETPESRFDKLVNYMERGFDKWLVKWRRLKW